jgi:hypothetical protein
VPLQLAIADQQVLALDLPVLGAARIDLEIHREGPLSPESPVDGPAAGPDTSPEAEAGSGPRNSTPEEELS